MKLKVFFLLLVFTISCSSIRNDIIGKWKQIEDIDTFTVYTIEFFENGQVKITYHSGSPSLGKYTFIGKDTLKLDLSTKFVSGIYTFRVSISDGQLILAKRVAITEKGKVIEEITKYTRL